MRKTYGKVPCHLCGEMRSNNGLARHSHQERHIREGLLERHLDEMGHPFIVQTRAGDVAQQALRRARAAEER